MKEHLKMENAVPKSLSVSKGDHALQEGVRLPSSKSISNRVLIIQYLAKSHFQIENLSTANDTNLMNGLLKTIKQNQNSETPVIIDGQDAGTVIRFLTALLSTLPGNWILTGSKRMQDRPIGILVECLKELGAEIKYLKKPGYPPISIKGKKLNGGEVQIDGSVSSQFITALMLIAPTLNNGLNIEIKNRISSAPYIKMTSELLDYFGVSQISKDKCIHIPCQEYHARNIIIESDWTSASYWYEMVAFAKDANILLKGINKGSIQGDSILPKIYNSFGVKTEFLESGIRLTKSETVVDQFDYDFTDCPDLAQSVIVTCAGLGIKGTFTGLESLRIKETDRLEAMKSQLIKLGVNCEIVSGSKFQVSGFGDSAIKIINQKSKIVNTFGDHRMAMAFAPLALIFGSVQIENPEVVSKSYPDFWNELEKAGFKIQLSF